MSRDVKLMFFLKHFANQTRQFYTFRHLWIFRLAFFEWIFIDIKCLPKAFHNPLIFHQSIQSSLARAFSFISDGFCVHVWWWIHDKTFDMFDFSPMNKWKSCHRYSTLIPSRLEREIWCKYSKSFLVFI